jgi:hypothetical protein
MSNPFELPPRRIENTTHALTSNMKDKIRANTERAAAEKRAANERAERAERATIVAKHNSGYKPSEPLFHSIRGFNAIQKLRETRNNGKTLREIANEKAKKRANAALSLESQYNPGVAGGRRTKRKTHRKHKRTHKRHRSNK